MNAFALETFHGSPSRGTGTDDLIIFHKTNDHTNPGVCDYSIAQTLLNQRKQSPKATIGNDPRW